MRLHAAGRATGESGAWRPSSWWARRAGCASWALAAGSWLDVGNEPVYVKSRCFEAFPFPDTKTGQTNEIAGRISNLAEQIDTHRKARQSAHADLTLTAMYNVLEQLRTGAPLHAKDKQVHDQGLVALKAQRCSEEAAGSVRWLRPAFQNSQGVQAALAAGDTGTDTAEADVDDTTANPAPVAITQRPWPAGVPEQIKAVADVLSQARRSLDLEELASHFNGRGRWRERLPTLLETLLTLGLLQQTGQGRWVNTVR